MPPRGYGILCGTTALAMNMSLYLPYPFKPIYLSYFYHFSKSQMYKATTFLFDLTWLFLSVVFKNDYNNLTLT